MEKDSHGADGRQDLAMATVSGPDQQALASYGRRAAACIIDMVLVFFLALLPEMIMLTISGILLKPPETSGSEGDVVINFSGGFALGIGLVYLAIVVILFATTSLYWGLTNGRRGRRNGQTIGQQLLAIRVVRGDRQPLGRRLAIKRWILGHQLPSFLSCGLFGLVDLLWPLFNARRQALHDKFSDTYVVVANNKSREESLS